MLFRSRGIFLGPVTDTPLAGDEYHAGRGETRHEQGVVVGAADHREERESEGAARGLDRRDNHGAGGCRPIEVERFHLCAQAAGRPDRSKIMNRVLVVP